METDIGFIVKKRIKTERTTTIQVQCLEGGGRGVCQPLLSNNESLERKRETGTRGHLNIFSRYINHQ